MVCTPGVDWLFQRERLAALLVLLILAGATLSFGRAQGAESSKSAAVQTPKQAAKEKVAPERDYTDDNRTLGFKKERTAPAANAASGRQDDATKAAGDPLTEAEAEALAGDKDTGRLRNPGMPTLPQPRSKTEPFTKDSSKSRGVGSSAGMVVVMVVVLGGCLVVALFLMKKFLPNGKALFSTPALEILGRTHFDAQRYLALVRVGKRLLVVGVGPNGFSPVSEISDEVEAADLMAVAKPKTVAGKSVFHRMFQSQLAATETSEFLASANRESLTSGSGDVAGGGAAGAGFGLGAEEGQGEFSRPVAGDNLDERRARMQAQIRSLRESE